MHREIPIRLSHQDRDGVVFRHSLLIDLLVCVVCFVMGLVIVDPTIKLRCQFFATLAGATRAIITTLQLEDCTDTAHC
jgi:hypothetical protein